MDSTERTICLDLGGTKIASRLVDGYSLDASHPRVAPVAPVARAARLPMEAGANKTTEDVGTTSTTSTTSTTPTPTTYDGLIATLRDICARQYASLPDTPRSSIAIAIAHPGTLDSRGIWSNANMQYTWQRPFKKDLANALNSALPCRVDLALCNDGDAFALAEARLGAGIGHAAVFGITLGTGAGCGFVYQGMPMISPRGTAPEWGHLTMPRVIPFDDGGSPAPRPCYCGRIDCIEQYLSGTAIEKEAIDQGANATAQASTLLTEPAIAHRFLCRMAAALGIIVNGFGPESIVFGGGVVIPPTLLTRLRHALIDHCFGLAHQPSALHEDGTPPPLTEEQEAKLPTLHCAALGNDAVMLGAGLFAQLVQRTPSSE